MKELDKVLKPIKMPDNVSLGKCTDEIPLIFIPNNKSYVEILGHRINEDFSSFESFGEYLKHIKEVEQENDILKAEKALLETYFEQIKCYLDLKITEASLERTYEQGMCFRSMRECIYESVLEEIKKIMKGKDE